MFRLQWKVHREQVTQVSTGTLIIELYARGLYISPKSIFSPPPLQKIMFFPQLTLFSLMFPQLF